MEAPNKIKIVRFSDTKELSDYWVLENRTKNEDIEYIRKDALLKWLEYKKGWFSGTDIEPHYQKVIDKLNSM